MNKSELIEHIAKQADISKAAASRSLEALIGAVARLALDPEQLKAEFALIVGREIAGQGVGTFLMKRLIDYARRRRMLELWGDVRDDNAAMLAVCDELGFSRSHASDEPGVVHVRKPLRSA